MAIDQGVRSKKETRADAQSVIDLAHKQGLKIVDLKFIDLIGTWQHFSIPVQQLSKGLFEDGIGFDKAFAQLLDREDRKSTRLNSSHVRISYAVFCLKKKTMNTKSA